MSMPPSTRRRRCVPLIPRLPFKLASTSSFSNQASSEKRKSTSHAIRRTHSKNPGGGGFFREGGKEKWPFDKCALAKKTGSSEGPLKVTRPLTSAWDA